MKRTPKSVLCLTIFYLLFIMSACEQKKDSQIVQDVDGNEYNIVEIGMQTWFADNLRTEHYKDGTPIPVIVSNHDWLWGESPGCCYFRNDDAYKEMYGAFYNWYAVTDSHGLCPEGWRVPSKEDFTTLVSYLGGHEVAGGKLKLEGTEYWISPNEGATNESGFSAIGTGARNHNSEYISEGILSIYWASDTFSHVAAWTMGLESRDAEAGIDFGSYMHGFSVRCLKDD